MAIIIFENALPVKEIMEEAKALIRAKTAQDFSQAIGVVPSRAGRLLRGELPHMRVLSMGEKLQRASIDYALVFNCGAAWTNTFHIPAILGKAIEISGKPAEAFALAADFTPRRMKDILIANEPDTDMNTDHLERLLFKNGVSFSFQLQRAI